MGRPKGSKKNDGGKPRRIKSFKIVDNHSIPAVHVDKHITILVNYVKNTENGESNDLAFSKIRKHLDSYIKMFGKKYKIPGCDADEIEQECLFALRYKAIQDFDEARGKFKSFAILCIKRHLFSLIKGNNQLKRRVLNTSLSLDQDRVENGENLTLASLVKETHRSSDEQISRNENYEDKQAKLFEKLSELEREVIKLYLKQMRYDEIAEELKKIMPQQDVCKKQIDNALVRARSKAQNMSHNNEFFEE